MSVGAYGTNPNEYNDIKMASILFFTFFGMMGMLVASVIVRRLQHKTEARIDEKNITPSDFTLFVNNLPLNKSEEEVKGWFAERFPKFSV